MKRWSIKLLSVLMVTMFVVSMSSTPVFAENSPPGNTFFEEWSESVSESDVVSELAGEPLDQQASFEAAVEIIEAIEAERMENAYIAEGPSLESILENDNYEVLTPEQLWDTFLQEKATSSQLASASLAARYEFRTFTNEAFADEERFAIYDNSTNRVVTGWEEDSNNPGKWWYYTEDGTKAVGWELIDSNWYYFEDEGLNYMVHGWLLDGYSYYYLGTPGLPETGARYDGNWLNDIEAGGTTANPKWYYLNPDGRMHHGWMTYNGDKYYMGYPGAPLSGLMYNWGWMTEYGDTYYFGADGIMKTDFFTVQGDEYYFGSDGAVRKGWFMIDADTYHGNRYSGALDTGVIEMSDYVTSTFGSDYRLLEDSMNSLGTITHNDTVFTIQNTRWANLYVRDNGQRGPTLSLVGTDSFNNRFSNGNTDLIEDAADYYNNNTDGLVVINTGSQFTTETAEIVVEFGDVRQDDAVACTYQQNKDGLWVNGDFYSLEEHTSGYYDVGFYVGEVIKSIIVFDVDYFKTHDVTSTQVKAILRHEIGHVIGLRHTYEKAYGETDPGISALMHPFYDSQYSSPTLTTYDLNELEKTYPY